MKVQIIETPFGTFCDKAVRKYTLTNANGMSVAVINYGGTITNIFVPDKNGETGDVVLGSDSLEGYLQNGTSYFGSLIGRYSNRIANGKFILNEIGRAHV